MNNEDIYHEATELALASWIEDTEQFQYDYYGNTI